MLKSNGESTLPWALRLTWADEQEVPDSHDERLARVRRQVQRDSVSERQEVAVSRTIPVVAMDANDSSDGSVQEQPEVVGRHQKMSCRGKQGVLQPAFLKEGLRSLDIVDLVNVFEVRPLVMKDRAILLEGHFQDCSQSQFCKKFEGVNTSTMTPRKSGSGNCSSYSRGFCCTDLQEAD